MDLMVEAMTKPTLTKQAQEKSQGRILNVVTLFTKEPVQCTLYSLQHIFDKGLKILSNMVKGIH